MKNSQVGDLLVASTMVEGTPLHQGVCLLVHEDDDQAIALMLNRPMQTIQVSAESINEPTASSTKNRLFQVDVSEKSDEFDAASDENGPSPTDKTSQDSKQIITIVGPQDDPAAGQMLSGKSLHFGGPLSGPVVAIHGSAELAEAEAGDGIFMAAQRDHLEALLQTDQPNPYRLIIGHLAWTPEQLNLEIAEGVWHRMPATSDILWTDDGLLWPALIRRATSHSVSRWLGVEHIADAHQLN